MRPWLVLVSADRPGPDCAGGLARLLPDVARDVDLVVLRWKDGPAREHLEAARRLAALDRRPRLVLSDRFDVAKSAGLEGVQLGESGLAPEEVRAHWAEALIGVSRHDAEGVARRSLGADYVLFSPVFPTPSKPGHAGTGTDLLASVSRGAEPVVIALGGMREDRVAAAIAAGAGGVAVRSAVFGAADPLRAVARLRSALDSAPPGLPDDEFVPRPDRGVGPE